LPVSLQVIPAKYPAKINIRKTMLLPFTDLVLRLFIIAKGQLLPKQINMMVSNI
jgi:hypothetical protein